MSHELCEKLLWHLGSYGEIIRCALPGPRRQVMSEMGKAWHFTEYLLFFIFFTKSTYFHNRMVFKEPQLDKFASSLSFRGLFQEAGFKDCMPNELWAFEHWDGKLLTFCFQSRWSESPLEHVHIESWACLWAIKKRYHEYQDSPWQLMDKAHILFIQWSYNHMMWTILIHIKYLFHCNKVPVRGVYFSSESIINPSSLLIEQLLNYPFNKLIINEDFSICQKSVQ